MGLFDKMKEPVFLKESNNAELQLGKMKAMEPFLNDEGKKALIQDMKWIEYGIAGERNIAFELKNSHMPMYVLHDIYLTDGKNNAQIDYLVITKKICFVIECKNLYGNVEITNTGNFIRTTEFDGKKKMEGIYSPITQNQRHIDLMKKIRMDRKSNVITKAMEEKKFDEMYKSVIVLSNPKTILDAKFAPEDIKEQVIRTDQLVNFIKSSYNKSSNTTLSDDKMKELAEFYLNLHTVSNVDVSKKYNQYYKKDTEGKIEVVQKNKTVSIEKKSKNQKDHVPVEESTMYKKLKEFRLKKSREENIKPYFIYNDAQLKDLITKMPKTHSELLKVSGFGEVKVKKYGADILRIMSQYQDL